MLNVAGINSLILIIYKLNNVNVKLPQREFLCQLSSELIYPYLRVRFNISSIPRTMKTRIDEIVRNNVTEESVSLSEYQRGGCTLCNQKNK